MKTYHKILIRLMVISLSFNLGCKDNIYLDPEGIITADSYFTSPADYDKALNSLYAMLNDNRYMQWLDAASDNALSTQSWNFAYDLGWGIANTFSSLPDNRWSRGYVAVQRTNNVINHIDDYDWPGGVVNPDRFTVLAEARAFRAYYYLDLVCQFGRIMFYTENPATVAESETIPQVEDPKKVFDLILLELEDAITGLPDQAPNKSKLGKPAARLLRARAAAYAAGYLGDKSYFDITLTETEELLKTAPVLGDYAKLFTYGNENIDEVILTKQYSVDIKNNWGDWYNNSIAGYCVTTPVKALVDAYEYMGTPQVNMPYTNKEPRFYASIYAPGTVLRDKYYNTIPGNIVTRDGKTYFDPAKDYGSLQDKEVMTGDVLGEGGGGEWNKTPTGFTFKKYCAELETWNTYNHFVVFRYAEAYLLRAEALVETGGSETEAKQLVQIIRDRAGNTNDMDVVIASLYDGSLLNLIRNERRVELAQEGLRLYDIRRWKLVPNVMSQPAQGIQYRKFGSGAPVDTTYNVVKTRAATNKDYWWPIPQSEIDLNKGRITQNDGWKE